MSMLAERLKKASSYRERSIIQDKIDFIHREARDDKIAHLRTQLVNAARAGDNKAGDQISEEIYDYQRRKGIIK